jgi:hypothetical protein
VRNSKFVQATVVIEASVAGTKKVLHEEIDFAFLDIDVTNGKKVIIISKFMATIISSSTMRICNIFMNRAAGRLSAISRAGAEGRKADHGGDDWED